MQSVEAAFGPDGVLARHFDGFSYREPQAAMAGAVRTALERRAHAVLEAGTGIGKTFAYLVPVLLAGTRAIVSTGTKNLQDQLYSRDLPALGRALGRPADIALLKGRNNYLCWHRLETAIKGGRLRRETRDALVALDRWGQATDSGDLSELDDFVDGNALTGLVTSTAENCLGSQCAELDRCFVAAARRRAMDAQVVIVNHHLLLADLALKEAGFGELLPRADAVIVDEAHLLADIAQQFFDVSLTSRELELLCRDLTVEARIAHSPELERRAENLNNAARNLRAGARLEGRQPWNAVGPRFHDAFADLREPIEELISGLSGFEQAGLVRCLERAESAAARLAAVVTADDADGVRWLEFGERSFGAHLTPLDVGRELRQRVEAQGGTWIMTSATLAVGGDFSHFVERVGIDAPAKEVFPSPFDFAENARLYIPEGLPNPSEPDQTEALLDASWPILEATGGGAFFLFTSYRALGRAERWFRARSLPGILLVQGEDSRHSLLETFRSDGNAILLGTGSFWQGVDVRGSALRLVVIDKLPFAAPGDPMVQARIQNVRRAGGDAFNEFQLPQAMLALKQGVGRLIRDFDDRGIVVLGDARLNTKAYGRAFLDSLPPMQRLSDLDDLITFARSLDPLAAEGAESLIGGTG